MGGVMPFLSAQQVPQFDNADFETVCPGSGCIVNPDPANPNHLPVCLEGWSNWSLDDVAVGDCDIVCSGEYSLKVDNAESPKVFPVTANPYYQNDVDNLLNISFDFKQIVSLGSVGGQYLKIYGTNVLQQTALSFAEATFLNEINVKDVNSCTNVTISVSQKKLAQFKYVMFALDNEAESLELSGAIIIDNIEITSCPNVSFVQVPSKSCTQICFKAEYPTCLDLPCRVPPSLDNSSSCGLLITNGIDEFEIPGNKPNEFCINFDSYDIEGHYTMDVFHFYFDENGNKLTIFLGTVEFDYVCCDEAEELVVTNTMTLSPGAHKYSKLVVGENATLTIPANADLYFTSGANFFVDGTVELHGSLNACSSTWQGVKLFKGASFNGYSGSRISNAKRGISSKPWGNYFGPATIHCDGTTFKNNELAVELMTTGGVFETDYVATFNNCHFVKDNQYPTNNFWLFVDILNMDLQASIDEPNFVNCTFINEEPNTLNANNSGISALDSRFMVGDKDTPGAFFKGVAIGVQSVNVLATQPYVVANSTFEDCAYGIFSSGVDGATVFKNKFRLGHLPAHYWYTVKPNQKRQVGLAMEGGGTGVTGIYVQENEFFDFGTKNVKFTIGSKIAALGQADNVIRNNSYTKLNFGNMANYVNGNNTLKKGIQYQCNTNLNPVNIGFIRFDFLAYSPKGGVPVVINPNQWYFNLTTNTVEPTYNVFAQHNRWDFYKQGAKVNYYYNNAAPNEKPRDGHYHGLNRIKIDPSQNHCAQELPKFTWTPSEKVVNEVNFFDSKANYEQLKTEEGAAIQSGNTALATQKQEELAVVGAIQRHYAQTGYLAGIHANPIDETTAKTWLQRLDAYEADLKLAQMACKEKNWTEVQSLLDNAPIKYDLTSTELEDLEKLSSIYEMVELSGSIQELPDESIASLKDMAIIDEGRAAGMARNILRAQGLYYAPIAVDLDDLEEVVDRSSNISSRVRMNTPKQVLEAYPNPADYLVEFDLGGGSLHTDAIVLITNALGVEVARLPLTAEKTMIVWDTHAIPDGIYFCRLQIAGKDVKTTKVVIRK